MRRRRIFLLLALVLVLALTSAARAMSSGNFEVGWLVPLSGGGGASSSTSYELNVTVGQTGGQSSTSAGYVVILGFWSLSVQDTPVFMPFIKR